MTGALNNPNRSVTNWYNLYGVEKAIFSLDSGDKGIYIKIQELIDLDIGIG